MPAAASFRFPKRALVLFEEWKRADSPPALAAVLAEMQDTLTERIQRQIRDLQWSLAQTVSDAYQELQQKALAQRWPAVEYPQLENLARKALVLLRHHILDRARRGKHRVPLDEALSTYADSRQPSEDFEARETAALVQMAVDSLEPDWRDAVRMKYLEGYSNEAIARVLGKPSNDAVRMLLVRARSALAELLIPSHE